MKAAAYARYSTDNQTKNSIAYQMDKIREYCEKSNITIVESYADEAESGTNTNRAGFIEMIAAAKRGEFDAVVIYDITRGSRDVADWFNFRKAMQVLEIRVISVEDKLGDITNPSDFLTELITVGLGQHQVLTTRQKSMDGVTVRAKQGAFLGGFAPLGYDIADGTYVINEREAEAVQMIFSMYGDGKSYNEILDAVQGVRGKRGQFLGKNSLNSILTNDRYIGIYTWNRRKMKIMGKWAGGKANPRCVRLEGIIPPIISMDVWERVQARMKSNRRAVNKAKRDYLLTGLIECEGCGATYVGHCSTNAKGYETRYYCCGNKYRTRSCRAKNINADEIEEFVIQQLKAYLLTVDFSEVANTIANAVNNAAPDLSKEKRELAEINRQIANGVKAVMNGLEIPELQDEIDRQRVRKSELEDIIARNTANHKKIDPAKVEELFHTSMENWDTDIKNIIRYHVTKIYAHVDGSYTVNIGVHINGCGGRI